MILEILGAWTWDPGFKGLLTVAVGVAILCGSVVLIVGTNSGARLGFLIGLTGLMGWFAVMGVIWSMYGIGWVGDSPTWHVVDTVVGDPADSDVERARSLPLPDDLPDPVELRDADAALTEEFPVEARDPVLGDIAGASEEVRTEINDGLEDGWLILETANGYTGETQSATAEALGPDGLAMFESASDYVVIQSFLSGGKDRRTDDSILERIRFRAASFIDYGNDSFMAAVQLQPVVPQETLPGEAPPSPVADEEAPVVTVIMERDRGTRRLPSVIFTIVSTIIFFALAWMVHNRDKIAIQQRAAAPAGV